MQFFPNLFLKADNFFLLLALLLGVILINVLVLFGVNEFVGRSYLIIAIQLTGIAILLKNGKFAYTKYARWVNGIFAITTVGVLFKVLYWPGADALLILSLSAYPILYWIYFAAEKRDFSPLSILKLVLVPLLFITPLFKIMHWPNAYELQIISNVVFVFTMAVFIIPNFAILTQKQ